MNTLTIPAKVVKINEKSYLEPQEMSWYQEGMDVVIDVRPTKAYFDSLYATGPSIKHLAGKAKGRADGQTDADLRDEIYEKHL